MSCRARRPRPSDPEGVDEMCSATPTSRRGEPQRRADGGVAGRAARLRPRTTVNRLCGSSLDAAMHAPGDPDAGMCPASSSAGSSRCRAPPGVFKWSGRSPSATRTLHSTTLGWRMVNPRMPKRWTIPSGRRPRSSPGFHGSAGRRRTRSRYAGTSSPPRPGRPASTTTGSTGPRTPASSATRACDRTRRSRARAAQPAFARTAAVTAGNASPLNDGAGLCSAQSADEACSASHRRGSPGGAQA